MKKSYSFKELADEIIASDFKKHGHAYMHYENLILMGDIVVPELKSMVQLKEIIHAFLPMPKENELLPDMPEPMFVAKYDNPKDMEILKKSIP